MSRRLRMAEQGGPGRASRGLPPTWRTGDSAIPSGGRAGTVSGATQAPSPVVRQEHSSGAGPVLHEEREGRAAPSSSGWPLRSRLELAALPSAVPSVRLHARLIVGEWGLGSIAETVELVVSELATNAVKVSAGMGSSAPGGDCYGMAPRCIALFLACDRRRVLVQIWDGDPGPPQPADVDENAESGRGLLLVEALSADWGWYWPEAGKRGKWVWATV
jgi:hypothetical protein